MIVLDVHVGGLEKQEDEEGVKGARRSGGREGGGTAGKGRIRNRKRERKDNWNNERKEREKEEERGGKMPGVRSQSVSSQISVCRTKFEKVIFVKGSVAY